jgi:predicted nuclease of predicted toxin-antitoxin system
MRIKLDESMPIALRDFLRSAGHDVEDVYAEGLSGKNDDPVIQTATKEQRLLITFDLDFADIRAYPPGSHGGVVVLRLTDQRWKAMKGPTEALVESGVLERLRGGLAIVDETRVRIRTFG